MFVSGQVESTSTHGSALRSGGAAAAPTAYPIGSVWSRTRGAYGWTSDSKQGLWRRG
jgi:hypothetical protein